MDITKFSPDLSRDAVFKPCSRVPFEFWDEFKKGHFCMENKWTQFWLAINLCHLSYCQESTLNQILEGKAKLIKIFEVRTQMAYAVEIGDFVYLVFQGSCKPEDTIIDLEFLPKKEESLSMHRGFIKAFSYLWPEIETFLKAVDENKLIITGHSLGGALAYILSTKTKFCKLITFGAPRVIFGNSDKVENEKNYRFVNCSDAVPTLPPAIFGFRHFGKMIFIDEAQGIHEDIGNKFLLTKFNASGKFLLNGKSFGKGNAPLKSLVDHAPINYSRALSRHLLSMGLEN